MSPETLGIDVAMPTSRSGSVLAETLQHLATSEREGAVSIETLRVVDESAVVARPPRTEAT